MHGRVAFLGPIGQGSLANVPDPFDDSVLGLITGIECIRVVFRFVKQGGEVVVKLRMALTALDEFSGGGG